MFIGNQYINCQANFCSPYVKAHYRLLTKKRQWIIKPSLQMRNVVVRDFVIKSDKVTPECPTITFFNKSIGRLNLANLVSSVSIVVAVRLQVCLSRKLIVNLNSYWQASFRLNYRWLALTTLRPLHFLLPNPTNHH